MTVPRIRAFSLTVMVRTARILTPLLPSLVLSHAKPKPKRQNALAVKLSYL